MLFTPSACLESRAIILKARAYVFVSIVIMGLLWTGLLSAISFVKGGFRSGGESAATIIFLTVQIISALYVPIFALADSSDNVEKSRWYSHTWFELITLYLLVALQFSASLVYTLLSPSFTCTDDSADREGECQLANAYISIVSWLTPVVLTFYIIYVTAICIRRSRLFRTIWRTPIRLVPWDSGLEKLPGASLGSDSRLSSSSYSGSNLVNSAGLSLSRFSVSQSSIKDSNSSPDSSRRVLRPVPREIISLPTNINPRNNVQRSQTAFIPTRSSLSPIVTQFPRITLRGMTLPPSPQLLASPGTAVPPRSVGTMDYAGAVRCSRTCSTI